MKRFPVSSRQKLSIAFLKNSLRRYRPIWRWCHHRNRKTTKFPPPPFFFSLHSLKGADAGNGIRVFVPDIGMFIASLTIWLVCRNIVQKPVTEEAAQYNSEFENEELVNLISCIYLPSLIAEGLEPSNELCKSEMCKALKLWGAWLQLTMQSPRCSCDGKAFAATPWPWGASSRNVEAALCEASYWHSVLFTLI